MRTTLALVLLLLPALAGCFGGDGDEEPGASQPGPLALARLRCLTTGNTTCNYEATVTPTERQANELSIAVNPTDPLNMIAAGKDYTPDEAGDCVWSGVYTTIDGGKVWTNQNVPGSPWKKLKDPTAPFYPETFSHFWCATDPVVEFGPDGTAYWTVMPYQCDRFSGSATGRQLDGTPVYDRGGFNDWLWTCSSMYVLVSHDKGITWPESEAREVAFGPRLEHDKQWIATAPNGNVLLCWDRDPSYQLDMGTPADQVTPNSVMACSVSRDKGVSWTTPTSLNTNWQGFTPSVEYDAANVAYAAYATGRACGVSFCGDIVVSSSSDGVTWSPPIKAGAFALPSPGGEYNWPVLRGSAFRIVQTPLIAIDRSTGPYAGSLYVTWFSHDGAAGTPEPSHDTGNGEIHVAYSRDQGRTWNETVRPLDDNETDRFDQFYPAISVDANGTLDLSWWDRRMDPNNHLFDVFFTYSKDGGQTWAPNLRVSEVSSDEQYSHHQNGMIFLGDYRDQASSRLGAHLVWVDTRHHKADVFTATVLR